MSVQRPKTKVGETKTVLSTKWIVNSGLQNKVIAKLLRKKISKMKKFICNMMQRAVMLTLTCKLRACAFDSIIKNAYLRPACGNVKLYLNNEFIIIYKKLHFLTESLCFDSLCVLICSMTLCYLCFVPLNSPLRLFCLRSFQLWPRPCCTECQN